MRLRFLLASITISDEPRMTTNDPLPCDGCGQPASPEHIAKRLQRLEWTTRYRPIHVGTVLLGAFAPKDAAEFLYAEGGSFAGEAKYVLAGSGVASTGRSWQAVLTEFQRSGFLLTYALECPLEPAVRGDEGAIRTLLTSRLPGLLALIRRSWRPKRIVPISRALEMSLASISEAELGCSLLLDDGKAFALDNDGPDRAAARLRQALNAPPITAR